MAVQDLARIEERLDKAAVGAVAISDNLGGILFQNMAEVMEFAKLLSLAGTAVPKHLRGNPGACLAVTIQALEWRMSPVAVANKSYEVNDRIAYEAQLIHAVIEARGPLKQRLRGKWEGEGVGRYCIVTGHLKGEVDPVEYRSPSISTIKVKNSPLWAGDPDQQLWYYATRAWCRRYCPDVLLGIYAEDELPEGPERAENITPASNKPDVGSRLKGGKGKRGFQSGNVAVLEHKPGETIAPIDLTVKSPEPVTASPTEQEATEALVQQAEDDGDGILADDAAHAVSETALLADAERAAAKGYEELRGFYRGLSDAETKTLAPHKPALVTAAKKADEKMAEAF